MISKKKKIFISVGDPSGDIHASNLMNQMLKLDHTLEFVGIGGPQMQELGLKTIVDFSDINVVGFWEVAKKYLFFRKLENKAKKIIMTYEIDLVLLVDYPGLNLRLAHFAKSLGKKVCYYIAPQLWAWGKNRAKKLANSIDKLLVVFPFEEKYFKDFGIDSEFVGHPLLDLDFFDLEKANIERENQICLIPGSRKQEVEEHLKLSEEIINSSNNKYSFALSKSKSLKDSVYSDFTSKYTNVKIYNDSREAMISSRFGIVKAGTSTLEASLLNLPFITIYRTSKISYFIGKYLINIGFLSMPNILRNKKVVEEYIQNDASPKKILSSIDKYMNNSSLIDEMQNEFKIIRKSLGKLSASQTAAFIIKKEFLD